MLLVIDNYDSFTYNVVQYFIELGADVRVEKNDAISVAQIYSLNPSHIVISPGPCSPREAGISQDVVAEFSGKIPLLGVCLGHQTIAAVFGAKIVRADKAVHGKTSAVHHSGKGVFRGIPAPVRMTRYHSLVVDQNTLPAELEVTAWTENGDGMMHNIMGLRHREYALEGVQFHPESVLSEAGHKLFNNFLSQ